MEFPYEELLPDHIRLLTLLPAEFADPLACSIRSAELDAVENEYDALSYSWATEDGNAEQELPLLLNDTPILITRNLYDGLKRVRLVDKDIRIWVDALCINQRDDAEKSIQVAQMADIYAGARNVFVWFGEGENAGRNELLLNVLQQIPGDTATVESQELYSKTGCRCFAVSLFDRNTSRCPGCVQDSKVPCWGGGSLFAPSRPSHADPMKDFLECNDIARQHAVKTCEATHAFFASRYWKRRWIIQELYRARNQCWHFGSCFIDVSAFPKGWLKDFWESCEAI